MLVPSVVAAYPVVIFLYQHGVERKPLHTGGYSLYCPYTQFGKTYDKATFSVFMKGVCASFTYVLVLWNRISRLFIEHKSDFAETINGRVY